MSDEPRVSSLTEIEARLTGIDAKLDSILRALGAAADETSANHQERVNLTQDVASIKRWREDVTALKLAERIDRLEALQRKTGSDS